MKKPRDVFDRLARATSRYAGAWATPIAPLVVGAVGLLGAAALLHGDRSSTIGRLLLVYTCPAWAAALVLSSRRWAPPSGEVEGSPMGPGWRFRTSALLSVFLAAASALAAARGDWHVAAAGGVALLLALPARDLGASKILGLLLALTTLDPPRGGPWRLVVLGSGLGLLALATWALRRSSARELAALRAEAGPLGRGEASPPP